MAGAPIIVLVMNNTTATIQKLIILITLKELAQNALASCGDAVLQVVEDDSLSAQHQVDALNQMLVAISMRDQRKLCACFKDGYTMMLLGKNFEELEKYEVAEVRVFDKENGDMLFVIPNSDLEY